jgi:hypothetical protein
VWLPNGLHHRPSSSSSLVQLSWADLIKVENLLSVLCIQFDYGWFVHFLNWSRLPSVPFS